MEISYPSAPDDLALHGVRVLGFATASRVADRFVLDAAATEEHLLDFEAFGWVRRDSFGAACTDWQVRPTRADPIALNDHADWRWDDRVLRRLTILDASFGQLCDQLTRCLERFGGYAGRFSAALRQAEAGQRAWVDAPDRDSCHIVWMQFHEDRLATLGLPRGSDS